MESGECRSDLVKGHASGPYSNAGRHLLFIYWRVTFSEATRPIFAQILCLQHDKMTFWHVQVSIYICVSA